MGEARAAGFRQWEKLGRRVKKGERAFHILRPWTVRAEEDDEEQGIRAGDPIVVGFAPVPVFGHDQTEGEPLPGREGEAAFVDSLPLVELAKTWGLTVTTFAGRKRPCLGYYRPGQEIALGVENLATWAHEMVHAADDRLGTLNPQPGQQLDNEVVAELGGAVLLEALGLEAASNRGGAFEYIQRYCREHKVPVLATCSDLLARTCAAVEHILEAAATLEETPEVTAAQAAAG